MISVRLFISLCLPLVAGACFAQVKPGPPADSGAQVTLPAADSFKEIAAQATAEKWLGLLDRGEYAKAWDECAQLFRARVTREQWTDSLPTTRAPFGAAKSRKVEVAAYKTSLPGAPDGQYVTVRFRTQFEKKDNAEELITLIFENGAWRPTGYFIR